MKRHFLGGVAIALAALSLGACKPKPQVHHIATKTSQQEVWQLSDGRYGYRDSAGDWFWLAYWMSMSNGSARTATYITSSYSGYSGGYSGLTSRPGVGWTKGSAPSETELSSAKQTPEPVTQDPEGRPVTQNQVEAEEVEGEAPAGTEVAPATTEEAQEVTEAANDNAPATAETPAASEPAAGAETTSTTSSESTSSASTSSGGDSGGGGGDSGGGGGD